MRNNFTWILFLILPWCLVTSRAIHEQIHTNKEREEFLDHSSQNLPKSEDASQTSEQIISVRITSSVAVGRGKPNQKVPENIDDVAPSLETIINITTAIVDDAPNTMAASVVPSTTTEVPPDLTGANIEYIKQLNAKNKAKGFQNLEQIHPYQLKIKSLEGNETEDSVAESSITVSKITEDDENIDDVPLARSVPQSPPFKNYIQNHEQKTLNERASQSLTTVSFSVIHDPPKISNRPGSYVDRNHAFTNHKQYYEPPKIYSQPAQIYSEPAKFYSEPAKIYSEPAKIYSEPAKVYGEPAKIYSEPARFYSPAASLNLSPEPQKQTPWYSSPTLSSTINTTPLAAVTDDKPNPQPHRNIEHQPEKNYEVDEKISVLTDGRSHGVQESSTEKCKQDNCKVGYVVEGRQYRKYRVEERTSDGFIVGEYGVVRNEDGALRGVRYTADSEASPRLIYDALMKFLQLK